MPRHGKFYKKEAFHRMKNKTSRVLVLVFAIIIAITAAAAICTYFALTGHFDHAIFHYDSSPVSNAARILPWCAIITALVCSIAIRRDKSLGVELPITAGGTFASVLTGLLMISSAVFAVIINQRDLEMRFPQIVPIAAAAAVLSAVYLIASPFIKNCSVRTAFSFAPAVWAASMLLKEYFRSGEPINSPLRDLDLSMYAFLLLYFTERIRFHLNNQKSAAYYFCAFSAFTFTGAAALPELAVCLTDDSFSFNFASLCVGAALVIFIAIDIITAIKVTGGSSTAPEHAAKQDEN